MVGLCGGRACLDNDRIAHPQVTARLNPGRTASNGARPPESANLPKFARVAELADALASGASVRKDVGVQVPSRALWVFQEIEYSFS